MKKISLFAVTSLLLATVAFAEPSETTTNSTNNIVEAVDVTDFDNINTSPVTEIDSTTENESVLIDNHLKAVPKTDHDENAEYRYTIDVTYPQIAGDNLSEAAQQFNQTMTKMVDEEINKFKNNVKLDAAHMNTLPEEVRKNYFKIDYDIDVIKPDAQVSIISVRLSTEGMQAGRAHPFHAHQVLNFDLTHGKILALNDLFKKNSKYLAAIAKFSNTKLNESLQDKWLIADGTKPKPNNYKNWNLQNDSLLITFDEYQVAPYVDGPQEVEIPLAELSKMLALDAPVMAEFKQPTAINSPKSIAKTKEVKKVADAQQQPSKKSVVKKLG
jgi:hypothetical protein